MVTPIASATHNAAMWDPAKLRAAQAYVDARNLLADLNAHRDTPASQIELARRIVDNLDNRRRGL